MLLRALVAALVFFTNVNTEDWCNRYRVANGESAACYEEYGHRQGVRIDCSDTYRCGQLCWRCNMDAVPGEIECAACRTRSSTTTTTTTTPEAVTKTTTDAAVTKTETKTTTEAVPKDLKCLCVFGFDRTLTAAPDQGCTGSEVVYDAEHQLIHDYAWGCSQDGPQCALTWSDAAVNYKSTFCSDCYSGLVTTGSKGTDVEAEALSNLLPNHGTEAWVGTENTDDCLAGGSAFLQFCNDKLKAVQLIMKYYMDQGMDFDDADVYYFSDTAHSVNQFQNSSFTAKQVSCASRATTTDSSSTIGKCGATVAEISNTSKGVSLCATNMQFVV